MTANELGLSRFEIDDRRERSLKAFSEYQQQQIDLQRTQYQTEKQRTEEVRWLAEQQSKQALHDRESRERRDLSAKLVQQRDTETLSVSSAATTAAAAAKSEIIDLTEDSSVSPIDTPALGSAQQQSQLQSKSVHPTVQLPAPRRKRSPVRFETSVPGKTLIQRQSQQLILEQQQRQEAEQRALLERQEQHRAAMSAKQLEQMNQRLKNATRYASTAQYMEQVEELRAVLRECPRELADEQRALKWMLSRALWRCACQQLNDAYHGNCVSACALGPRTIPAATGYFFTVLNSIEFAVASLPPIDHIITAADQCKLQSISNWDAIDSFPLSEDSQLPDSITCIGFLQVLFAAFGVDLGATLKIPQWISLPPIPTQQQPQAQDLPESLIQLIQCSPLDVTLRLDLCNLLLSFHIDERQEFENWLSNRLLGTPNPVCRVPLFTVIHASLCLSWLCCPRPSNLEFRVNSQTFQLHQLIPKLSIPTADATAELCCRALSRRLSALMMVASQSAQQNQRLKLLQQAQQDGASALKLLEQCPAEFAEQGRSKLQPQAQQLSRCLRLEQELSICRDSSVAAKQLHLSAVIDDIKESEQILVYCSMLLERATLLIDSSQRDLHIAESLLRSLDIKVRLESPSFEALTLSLSLCAGCSCHLPHPAKVRAAAATLTARCSPSRSHRPAAVTDPGDVHAV